jgi:hypothetical protein
MKMGGWKDMKTMMFYVRKAGVDIKGASDVLDLHDPDDKKGVLLKAYGSTVQTYQMFSSGGVALPQNIRAECIELLRSMTLDQLKTAHPVLLSLSVHK